LVIKNKGKFVLLILILFVSQCGVGRIPFIVEGYIYEEKTFTFYCGEMNVNVYQIRSDYRIDLKLKSDSEMRIYRDSLSVQYDNEEVEHGFSEEDQHVINTETDFSLFAFMMQRFIPPIDNRVKISFDGFLYCKDQKVKIADIFIER